MSQRKGLGRIVTVSTVMVTTIIILSFALIFVQIFFKSYFIPAFLCTVPILTLVHKIASDTYEKNLSSTKTSISVSSTTNNVVVTCTLKSFHPKRLFIDKAYLFIDTGILQEKIYKFKHILQHEYGETSCLIEKKMCNGDISCYKDINNESEGYFSELKHLSSSTILYLDTEEEFSDDIVFQLTPGVYRAMFVTTFKNADCNCAIKHFVV
jgi:hypothetical protein